MDDKVLKIVSARLKKFEGQPMTNDKLAAIRQDVYKATKTNKFASFSNVKKWVKAARKMMKESPIVKKPPKKGKAPKMARKKKANDDIEPSVSNISRKIEESLNVIKDEVASAPMKEVELAKPTVVFDKVYLQSIKFEIAGIRQSMERISRQLDRLEDELSEHAE